MSVAKADIRGIKCLETDRNEESKSWDRLEVAVNGVVDGSSGGGRFVRPTRAGFMQLRLDIKLSQA